MTTREIIDEKYLAQHKELYQRFYERREITKEQHLLLHAELWSNHHQELVDVGLAETVPTPEPPPEKDWQAEWDAASAANKSKVLARMLGLKAP